MLALLFIFVTSAFATTPDYIKTHAVEFHGDDIPSALTDALDKKKLILVGEAHGIAEFPEYALQIIKAEAAKHPMALGLEFPKSIEGEVRKFVRSGDLGILRKLKFFQDAELHSGRGSEAMVSLLRALGTVPGLDVFCFDEETQGSDRDSKMAMNVLSYMALHPGRLVLTYSGNIHSRVTSGFPGAPAFKTMGSEILRFSGGVLNLENTASILFRTGEGSAWNCLSDEKGGKPLCGIHELTPPGQPYVTPFERYFLAESEVTEGHSLVIFIRKTSASTPFR